MATTSLTNFLLKVNRLLGDDLTGTTTAAGNAAKKTFVDAALAKYGDGYFGDPERLPEWWAYISSQLRPIKTSEGSSGTIEVYTAFSALIASSTAYELHHFDRDKKIVACNQALYDAYPYFYQRVEDSTTLDGTGPSDTEYTVPVAFTEFPDQIWEKYVATNYVSWIPITNFDVKEESGTMKFCANITNGRDILLIGKKYLSQFTNDASTTELSDGQANTIALLASAIFCRMTSAVINATDSGRFDGLANRFETQWNGRKLRDGMPLLAPQYINFGRQRWYAPGW